MNSTAPLVTGLTIVRNGVRLDYPFVEAVKSALPICDEYLLVVGDSDDGTLEVLEQLNEPKVRIIQTNWSPYVEPRKCVLAQQTNIGLHQCRGRWCLYLQANEVLHEDSLLKLRRLMEEHAENREVEALLLERLTFWGGYRHYFTTYPQRWKFTVRIIKPHIGMYSIRDAMSFAVFDNFSTHGRYPRALDTGENIYRYGFVRSVEKQAEKHRDAVHERGSGDLWSSNHYLTMHPKSYFAEFKGTHPAVMREREQSFETFYDPGNSLCRDSKSWHERRRLLETACYERFGFPRHRNNRYRLIGDYKPKPRP